MATGRRRLPLVITVATLFFLFAVFIVPRVRIKKYVQYRNPLGCRQYASKLAGRFIIIPRGSVLGQGQFHNIEIEIEFFFYFPPHTCILQ